MPDVIIDGIRYVPQTSIEQRAPGNVMEAARCLLISRRLYGAPSGCRGERGEWWDALRALVGDDVADLAVDYPGEAWLACGGNPDE